MTYHLEARNLDNLSTDTFLIRYLEISDSLIFTANISFICFQFFCFFDHLFRYGTELSSLMGKHICLVFIGLDFFFEARVFTILIFYTALHLLDSIMVVSYELLDLLGPDVEVEDTIGKRVQKLGIMRDDEHRPVIVLEK